MRSPDAANEEARRAPAPDSPRERRRREIVARVPPRYSPAFHLTAPSLVILSVMALALSRIHGLRPAELAAVPATLIVAFAFEWRAHRLFLHRRVPLAGSLYVAHELMHHVVFTHDDMALRSRRELWLVLMPAYAAVLIFLFDLPLALGLSLLVTPNVACVFVATSMLFFFAYEWLHLAYHLPPGGRVGKNPLIARLRRLHQLHHDPRLMKRYNFNITFPVFDWVHGTRWPHERAGAEDEARTRAS